LSITKTSYFYFKSATMQPIKQTALSLLVLAFILSFSSCEKDSEKDKVTLYSKSGIVMSGGQETPPNPSTAVGSMDVSYSKAAKVLSYKVTWSGLTDSVLLMHIHGLAPTGFATGVVQNIVTPSGGIFPQKTGGKFTFSKSGTISGTLIVDGVKVKEENLLNGLYYMNIHTTTYPAGEIRAQISFQ
jgi:hypothetical protein